VSLIFNDMTRSQILAAIGFLVVIAHLLFMQ